MSKISEDIIQSIPKCNAPSSLIPWVQPPDFSSVSGLNGPNALLGNRLGVRTPFVHIKPEDPVSCKKRFHIMIVDHDPMTDCLTGCDFPSDEFRIANATSSQEALKLLSHDPPHLVIVNTIPSGKPDLELFRHIRNLFNRFELPIICLLPDDCHYDPSSTDLADINEFLTKPLEKNYLLTRISRQLEIRRFTLRFKSINQFSDRISKFRSPRHMFSTAFTAISSELDMESGVLLEKGKVIQLHRHDDEKWEKTPVQTNRTETDEISCKKLKQGNMLVTVAIQDFDDFRMQFKLDTNLVDCLPADLEFIRNIVNNIKRSKYTLKDLVQDPVNLQGLVQIRDNLDRVLFVRSIAPYCSIYFEDSDQTVIFRTSIQALQRYFEHHELMRIQRSFLVNPSKIRRYRKVGKNDIEIILASGDVLPVSRNLAAGIKQKYPETRS